MNYAVVDENGLVVNVIAWDGVSEYNPGVGLTVIKSDEAHRGDSIINGELIKNG